MARRVAWSEPVIANARRHREERRTRADLEALIDTSPVAVVVFDARAGRLASLNREARRLVDLLRTLDQTPEDLLRVLTLRRGDGREVSLAEYPIEQAMRIGETVRRRKSSSACPAGGRCPC